MAGEEAEIYNPIKRHAHSTVKFVAELCEGFRLIWKRVGEDTGTQIYSVL